MQIITCLSKGIRVWIWAVPLSAMLALYIYSFIENKKCNAVTLTSLGLLLNFSFLHKVLFLRSNTINGCSIFVWILTFIAPLINLGNNLCPNNPVANLRTILFLLVVTSLHVIDVALLLCLKMLLISAAVRVAEPSSQELQEIVIDVAPATVPSATPDTTPAGVTAAQQPQPEECIICLEPFRPDSRIGSLRYTDCTHHFHRDCIVAWLRRTPKCPVCRRNALG